jgi:hypothetical protein
LAVGVVKVICQDCHEADNFRLGDATSCEEDLSCHEVRKVVKDIREADECVVAGLVDIEEDIPAIFSSIHNEYEGGTHRVGHRYRRLVVSESDCDGVREQLGLELGVEGQKPRRNKRESTRPSVQ